jgi:hypothetical protein
MPDRDVWLKASAIVSTHGNASARYVASAMCRVLKDEEDITYWYRGATADDAIADATLQIGYR